MTKILQKFIRYIKNIFTEKLQTKDSKAYDSANLGLNFIAKPYPWNKGHFPAKFQPFPKQGVEL